MNNQGWIAAIVALLAGVVIGHFLIPGKTQTVEGPDKGRGTAADRGPPSQLPQVMGKAPGTWPLVDCNGQQAILLLDAVYFKAMYDHNEGTLLEPEITETLNLIYACAESHGSPTPEHCTQVQEALGAAQGGDWQMARRKLEHED